jgi:hypothetical protein
MMDRKLTTGEREAIAGALYKLANERQEEADAILAGAGFFKDKDEPDEEANAKLERLAGTIIGRYRSLQKSAWSYGNLGDFLTNRKHTVTVDCIVDIPEQF